MIMANLWKFVWSCFQTNKRSCVYRGSFILMLFFGECFYGSVMGDGCMLLAGIVLFLSPQKEEVDYE